MKLPSLSLFFPCHNEEANVKALLADALEIAPQVAKTYEVIIVDDGSTDRTAFWVQEIAMKDERVRLVRHPFRQGYGEALKSGFRAARYAWIFYSDGDRQFDLAELPRLVARSAEAPIVSGFRLRRADPWYRSLNSKTYGLALRWLLGVDIPDVNGAFKLYRRDVFDRLKLKTSGALINAEIFAKAKKLGFSVTSVGVSHRPRVAGQQTGAQPKVILKAMREFLSLWWDVRQNHADQ